MAQYKVPQDVEADDKLLGPFTFRQLAYLLIAAGFIALAVLFFQIFPALCFIPALPALFLIVLALPLKKDQPMETYIAALVSYYTKPRKRTWMTGQSESTIMISAPKINPEDNRVRNISGEEATNRLSFLADIVDSQGAAINGIANSTMRDDLAAEAKAAVDIFEQDSYAIDKAIKADEDARREELIKRTNQAVEQQAAESKAVEQQAAEQQAYAEAARQQAIMEAQAAAAKHEEAMDKMRAAINENENISNAPSIAPKINHHFFEEVASSKDFSVETIAKQANKINNRKDDGEIFISLH